MLIVTGCDVLINVLVGVDGALLDENVDNVKQKKRKRKKRKREDRKRWLNFPGVRRGFWQSSAEKWEGQRNYSPKYSLHKYANSCLIRKDQRFEVHVNSFALHSPFTRNLFVT